MLECICICIGIYIRDGGKSGSIDPCIYCICTHTYKQTKDKIIHNNRIETERQICDERKHNAHIYADRDILFLQNILFPIFYFFFIYGLMRRVYAAEQKPPTTNARHIFFY